MFFAGPGWIPNQLMEDDLDDDGESLSGDDSDVSYSGSHENEYCCDDDGESLSGDGSDVSYSGSHENEYLLRRRRPSRTQ